MMSRQGTFRVMPSCNVRTLHVFLSGLQSLIIPTHNKLVHEGIYLMTCTWIGSTASPFSLDSFVYFKFACHFLDERVLLRCF